MVATHSSYRHCISPKSDLRIFVLQSGSICRGQPTEEDLGGQLPARPLLRAACSSAHQASLALTCVRRASLAFTYVCLKLDRPSWPGLHSKYVRVDVALTYMHSGLFGRAFWALGS